MDSPRIIDLPVVADPRGNLSFIQGGGPLSFEIQRCYWIYDVPGGKVRHGRALRHTTELIVALSGSFDAVIDGEVYHLCRGYQGLLVPPMHWRELVNFSTNAVALVLADTVYDEADYIRKELSERSEESEVSERSEESEQSELSEPSDNSDNPNNFDASNTSDTSNTSDSSDYSNPSDYSDYSDLTLPLPRRVGENGCLTEVENTPACPFEIKRVYYLYDVPADSRRGGHAHHQMESLIVAASGSFDVLIDDGTERRRVTLNRPFQALRLRKGVWRELDNFSSGAICLVIASEKYDEADYIRDYGEFIRLKGSSILNSPSSILHSDSPRFPFLDLGVVNAPYAQALKEACARVIDSGHYIGGPEVEAVEADIAKITETRHAVGVSNGLDALRLILRAWIELGRLAPGDEVIVPADTYIASVLAITDNGLRPVFVDADLHTYNIDISKIEQAITPRTRAIMAVHLYGRVCWSPELADIALRHGLLIIEDNAQAIGARALCPGLHGTRATGGLGHAGAFSFYPTKNVGALGDAGAVTTNDADLAATVRSLRNYGTDRPYHNLYAGLNCRLDPIQGAMLRVKLPYADEENARRRRLAEIYDAEITNPRVVKPALPQSESGAPEDAARSHVWHQYVVRVADRDAFRKYLIDKGVETGVHYPVMPSQQPCYSQYAHIPLPAAAQIAREVVSLPIGMGTSPADACAIAQIINGYGQ